MEAKCKNCEKDFKYKPSQKYGIYCSNKCQGEYSIKKRFTKNGKWHYNMSFYVKKLRGNKCEECGITEWLNKELVMHVDHVDGDRTNNTLDNLKILCPNCHSQTPTFASKNVSAAGKCRMAESAKLNRVKKK
jgi:hypothetical protein